MLKLKLFSIAEIVLLTTAIFVISDNKSAFASTCNKSVDVPWSWSLIQQGTSSTVRVVSNNSDESFSKETGSGTIRGSYTTKLNFDPPTNYCTKKNEPSTSNELNLDGSFTGYLETNYIPIPNVPLLQGPYAGASASINVFSPFTNEVLEVGSISITQKRSKNIGVVNNTKISFDGNLDVFAYIGPVLSGGGYSFAGVALSITANLEGPNSGVATYTVPDPEPTPTPTPQPTPTPTPQPTPEPPKPPLPPTDPTPIPEPLTILGSMAALGFGAYAERKRKSSNSSEEDNTKDS